MNRAYDPRYAYSNPPAYPTGPGYANGYGQGYAARPGYPPPAPSSAPIAVHPHSYVQPIQHGQQSMHPAMRHPASQYPQQQPQAWSQPAMPAAISTEVPAVVAPRRGAPAFLAFFFGLMAAAVALAFDVVFLKVHIPGVGGYAWYLTTALSFAAAGSTAVKWTRAGNLGATSALVFASLVYGAADVALGLILEGLSMQRAVILGAQGVAIGLVVGVGAVTKALRARED